MNSNRAENISEVFHKEKNQKKYNKTKGQIDNLKGYTKATRKTSGQIADQPTPDKLIKREANYIKNIHIDEAYQRLKSVGLVTDDKYRPWWCGVMHQLGVSYVIATGDHALKYSTSSPAALFHFLINKELNVRKDPLMPRF